MDKKSKEIQENLIPPKHPYHTVLTLIPYSRKVWWGESLAN